MPDFKDYNKCGMLINKSKQEQPVRTWTRVETFCNMEAYKNFTTEQLDFRRKQEILKYKKNANTISKKQLYSYVNKFRNVKNTSTFIKKGNTLICPYEYYYEWTQLGQDICGNNSSDQLGYKISLNSYGDIIAVDIHNSDISNGIVKVYQYKPTIKIWEQIGQDISGNTLDMSGSLFELNSNGDILTIGIPSSDISGTDSGLVQVYKYKILSNEWVLLGHDICGNNIGDKFGGSVSINSYGYRIAIGSPNIGDGLVEIYNYNSDTDKWTQLGEDICGNIYNNFGSILELNTDGNILAIGNPYADISGTDSGLVQVYKYNDNTDKWEQIGQDICGNNINDLLGYSISLNTDGYILAIGIPGSDISGVISGAVKVYNYNNNNNEWKQYGQDICGNYNDEQFGWSVSLNSKGDMLLIGNNNNNNNNNNSKQIKLYKFNITNNKWELYSPEIFNNDNEYKLGYSVALNSLGDIFAIGSPDINNGLVKIYNLEKKILEKTEPKVPLVNYNTFRSYPSD